MPSERPSLGSGDTHRRDRTLPWVKPATVKNDLATWGPAVAPLRPQSDGGRRTCTLAGGVVAASGRWSGRYWVGRGPTRPVSSRPGTVPTGGNGRSSPAGERLRVDFS